MATRPAVGYMRPTDDERGPLDSAMREYADARGYVLQEIFIEDTQSASSGFSNLMSRLDTLENAMVIVPDLGHLAKMVNLQAAVRQVIEDRHTLVIMYPEAPVQGP